MKREPEDLRLSYGVKFINKIKKKSMECLDGLDGLKVVLDLIRKISYFQYENIEFSNIV